MPSNWKNWAFRFVQQKMNRVALFGGTFDPIHNGHINLAKTAVKECNLDELIFVPNYISPFKQGNSVTPGEKRAAMIQEILPLDEAFRLSSYELERTEPSYTYDTLCYFRNQMEDTEIAFIIGFDSVLTIDKWYHGSDILREFPLITGVRPHVETSEGLRRIEAYQELYGSRIQVLNLKPFDVSSTEIRRRIQVNESVDGLIAPEVKAYIERNQLYRN